MRQQKKHFRITLEQEREISLKRLEELKSDLLHNKIDRLAWHSVMTILNRIDQTILDRDSIEKARLNNAQLMKNNSDKFTGWEILTMDQLGSFNGNT